MVPIGRRREKKREGRGGGESGAMQWRRPWRIGKSETRALELGFGERKGFGFKIGFRVLCWRRKWWSWEVELRVSYSYRILSFLFFFLRMYRVLQDIQFFFFFQQPNKMDAWYINELLLLLLWIKINYYIIILHFCLIFLLFFLLLFSLSTVLFAYLWFFFSLPVFFFYISSFLSLYTLKMRIWILSRYQLFFHSYSIIHFEKYLFKIFKVNYSI